MDKVVHFEVAADDLARAKRLYEDVFGWQITRFPETDYTTITTVEVDEQQTPKEPGAINGGMYTRGKAGEPTSIVIGVPSIDECVKKIEQAGGDVVDPKTEAPGMGVYAHVNLVGLWEDLPQ